MLTNYSITRIESAPPSQKTAFYRGHFSHCAIEGKNLLVFLLKLEGAGGGAIVLGSDGPVKGSEKVVQKGEKKKKDRKQTVSIGASIEMPVS